MRLFIDARDVLGASIGASGDRAVWLRRRKANLESIMRIYTEPEVFDAAVAQSLR